MTVYRGGYLGIVKHRAPMLIKEHTFGFIVGMGFFAMSRMLIGMGLMKLGVFRPSDREGFLGGWSAWAMESACHS